ncbi:MAG: GatB/YqeY domain-containing protein [Candidatus Moranbacteria bacterium]|nr:GatB/YqeY domain-containing protein [Candidatus Moranbacteria bacterium]
MALYETIHGDLKDAMKAGDAVRRDTIRLLESALKNEAIEKRKPVTELSDQEVVAVLRRLSKQRRESAESYRAGGREDLASQEEAELALITEYLPAAMPEADIRQVIAEAKAETGASSKADFGKLMGATAKKIAGRADGNIVKALVEEALV